MWTETGNHFSHFHVFLCVFLHIHSIFVVSLCSSYHIITITIPALILEYNPVFTSYKSLFPSLYLNSPYSLLSVDSWLYLHFTHFYDMYMKAMRDQVPCSTREREISDHPMFFVILHILKRVYIYAILYSKHDKSMKLGYSLIQRAWSVTQSCKFWQCLQTDLK